MQCIIDYVDILLDGANHQLARARREARDVQWTIRPLLDDAVQLDSVSCGMWSIAQMFAVLRGYTITGINHTDATGWFRSYILFLLLQLPPALERTLNNTEDVNSDDPEDIILMEESPSEVLAVSPRFPQTINAHLQTSGIATDGDHDFPGTYSDVDMISSEGDKSLGE